MSDPTMESGNSRQPRLRLAETLGGLDLFGSHFLVREDLLHEIHFFFMKILKVHGRGSQKWMLGYRCPGFNLLFYSFSTLWTPESEATCLMSEMMKDPNLWNNDTLSH